MMSLDLNIVPQSLSVTSSRIKSQEKLYVIVLTIILSLTLPLLKNATFEVTLKLVSLSLFSLKNLKETELFQINIQNFNLTIKRIHKFFTHMIPKLFNRKLNQDPLLYETFP